MVDSTDKGIIAGKLEKLFVVCFAFSEHYEMSFVNTMLQDHFTNVRKMTINMKYIGMCISSDSLYLSC